MPRSEFTKRTKEDARKRANGFCECGCGQPLKGRSEFDHKLEAYLGGTNDLDNCVVMSAKCHALKTAKRRPEIDKTCRISEKNAGVRKRKGRPMMGTIASGWRKKMDGTAERR